jgi:hypothetical protein
MSVAPTHGWTKHGHAVHAKTLDHMPVNNAYARFNKWLAVKVTTAVGSMTCAYIFSVLALLSLPAILSGFHVFHNTFPGWLVKTSVIALVSWIAQTYIQLVLLSVIIVGQNIQSAASDVRAAKTFEDVEAQGSDIKQILQALDLKTSGGLTEVLSAVKALKGAPVAPARAAKAAATKKRTKSST